MASKIEPKKYTLESMFSIRDKTVIITGASRGLRESTTSVFSCLGEKIVLASRGTLEFPIFDAGGQQDSQDCLRIAADVRMQEQVYRMVQITIKKFGQIDVLINNAGIFLPSLPENIAEEDWDVTIDTNLKGPFLCAQTVGKIMTAQN